MPIQGLRTTDNFITNARPENWRQGILLNRPNGDTPLVALTSLMKSRPVTDPHFHWFEKLLDDRHLVLTASATALTANAADNTVALLAGQTGTKVKAGDLLYVMATGEVMRVDTDPASELNVVVTRAFAGTTAQAVDGTTDNPYIAIIGSAFEEGSLPPTGVNYDPEEKLNYTQIFRSTLEMTGTAMNTDLRTGDQVKEAKRECLEYVTVDMERSFWLGKRSVSIKNGKPLRTTNGLLQYIHADNQVDVANPWAGADLDTFEDYMRRIFVYGSSEKMGFCGNLALLAIQQICRKNSDYQFMQGQREFGMSVNRLISPFGELVLKNHPLFTQSPSKANTYEGMNSWLVAVDMAEVSYVNMRKRDLQFQKQLEVPGQDGMKSGYIGEVGLEVHHPENHFIIKGLVKGVADA